MVKVNTAWRWMIPVLLLASWVGARGLNADALWFDEYWSVYNAGGAQYGPLSPGQIWTRVAEADPWQAPGYFLLLGGWGALAGWTPFALRGLSLLAGVLSVAWAYRLGRDLVSPLGGLGAAVTMGLSAYFLYYFHEMRTYTLVVMLITMTGWAYWRATNGGGRWTMAALLVGAVGLLYTHYFAALTVAVLGLYHLLFVKKNRRWLRTALVLGAAAVCFLPWLGVLLSGLNSAVEDTLRQSNAWTPRQAVGGVLFMFSNGGVIAALLLAAASLFTPPLPRGLPSVASPFPASEEGEENDRANDVPTQHIGGITLFAWFWLLGVLALLLVINARFGVILEVRYLFPLWPPLALVMGIAVHRLSQMGARQVAYAVLALWAAAGVWNSVDADSANTLSNPHWHQPWDALVDVVQPRLLDGDALVYLLPDWTWPSYHQAVFDHYLDGLPVRGSLLQRPENVGVEAFEQQVLQAVENVDQVWLATTADQPTSYTGAAAVLLRGQSFIACGEVASSPELNLQLFTRRLDAPTRFGEAVTNSLLESRYLAEEKLLSVTAIWSPDPDVPPDTYSVGLHVKNAEGALAAQADYGLPNESFTCRSILIDVSALPPGDYTVEAVVYNWQTGERLPALRTGGSPQQVARVGAFSVP